VKPPRLTYSNLMVPFIANGISKVKRFPRSAWLVSEPRSDNSCWDLEE
jgi:hypothetical protein